MLKSQKSPNFAQNETLSALLVLVKYGLVQKFMATPYGFLQVASIISNHAILLSLNNYHLRYLQ